MSEPQPFDFAKPGRLTAEVEHRTTGWLRAAAIADVDEGAELIDGEEVPDAVTELIADKAGIVGKGFGGIA